MNLKQKYIARLQQEPMALVLRPGRVPAKAVKMPIRSVTVGDLFKVDGKWYYAGEFETELLGGGDGRVP